jgi:regulator of replication initiation timing
MTQQPQIDAKDLLDAIVRQRDESMNALAASNAMTAKMLRENEALQRENTFLKTRLEAMPELDSGSVSPR